jgi:hypothetical protein
MSLTESLWLRNCGLNAEHGLGTCEGKFQSSLLSVEDTVCKRSGSTYSMPVKTFHSLLCWNNVCRNSKASSYHLVRSRAEAHD